MFLVGFKILIRWLFCECVVGFCLQAWIDPIESFSNMLTISFVWSLYVKGTTVLAIGTVLIYAGYAEYFFWYFSITADDFDCWMPGDRYELLALDDMPPLMSETEQLPETAVDSSFEGQGFSSNDEDENQPKSFDPEKVDKYHARSHMRMMARLRKFRRLLTDPIMALETGSWKHENGRLMAIYSTLVCPLSEHTLPHAVALVAFFAQFFFDSYITNPVSVVVVVVVVAAAVMYHWLAKTTHHALIFC